MALRLIPFTAAALLCAAAPAQAGVLTAAQPVERACSARLLPSSAAGADHARRVPRADGMLEVRLDGRRGDWDVAVFAARSGRRLGAAATFGPRERAIAGVRRGAPVVVQACRRSGRSGSARLRLRLHPTSGRPAPPVRLVEVAIGGAADRRRLEAAGFDVTHAHGDRHADVVLYSAVEAARLTALGFSFRTEVADLAAETRRVLASRSAAGAALPSGRTSYRTLADYGEDLKRLVDGHPGLVRRVEVGRSLEDRPIEGVEIAAGVDRADDGRPVFLVLGLHHAREWPSGEMPMEFAIDLAEGYGSDPRITALLEQVRVILLPVVNPDGFEVSRSSPDIRTLEQGAYKRKNCRPTTDAAAAIPCALRFSQGVDLNRNYGAYWGGVGSSSDPTSQAYRGPAPFSEPESEAIHRLSSTRNVVTVISHHTYTSDGVWLRQPGFCANPPAGCDSGDVVPDEAGMAALGDAMAEATGWRSALSWDIGEITGATEDWNYFATGAYGYTPEQRGANFHPEFGQAVAAEYDGTGPGADGGVREALLRAAENTADPAFHAGLRGRAAPGHVLRLTKEFQTPTSQEGLAVAERLDITTVVRPDGTFDWDVNQSTRPLSPAPEAYRLTCETPHGAVLEARDVVVARGQVAELDICRSADPPAAATSRIRVVRRSLSARRANRGRRVAFTVRVDGAPVSSVRATLRRAGRVYARRRAETLSGRTRLALRRTRRLRPGRHRLRVAATAADGRRLTARRSVRVRR